MSLRVIERPSPNHEPRRGGRRPDMLILHYTAMASAAEACAWLCAPESKVSSHYLVDEDGTLVRMVAESERAWHAGVSSWHGETDINSCSIGIEIHNRGPDFGKPVFPEPQMRALEALCREVVARHAIPPERVLAHSDVAPRRKIDPGETFDWRRLARAGIGMWAAPAPLTNGPALARGMAGPEVAALQDRLRRFGYELATTRVFDRETEQVVAAFQRHWRQSLVDGRADASTMATLARLTAMLPPVPRGG